MFLINAFWIIIPLLIVLGFLIKSKGKLQNLRMPVSGLLTCFALVYSVGRLCLKSQGSRPCLETVAVVGNIVVILMVIFSVIALIRLFRLFRN